MRIISGKFKGHRLVSFDAKHIRPTTDRVKETLFNKLMGWTEGARVLDLFSGTGNLGIEALSRDAAFVEFVEEHPKSLRILRENLSKLKVTEGFAVEPVDVFKFLKRFSGDPFHIILADPPFTGKIADRVMTAIGESAAWGAGTIVAFESGTKESIGDAYNGLILTDRKKFGDKTLSLFEGSGSKKAES
jgi:16S rRNA (guanine966-N2)-methyltransferase